MNESLIGAPQMNEKTKLFDHFVQEIINFNNLNFNNLFIIMQIDNDARKQIVHSENSST